MTNIYDRKCKQCGCIFSGGPRAWYCPECRNDRRAEYSRRAAERRRTGRTRQIGSTDVCVVCGRPYYVTCGLQKYCPDCAPAAYAKIDAAQGLEYYRKNKSQINPKRYEKRKSAPKRSGHCVLCGVEIPRDIGTIPKYCKDCRAATEREQRNIWSAKNRIVFPSMDTVPDGYILLSDYAKAKNITYNLAYSRAKFGRLRGAINVDGRIYVPREIPGK